MNLTVDKAKKWILTLNDKLQEQKMYLTELDQAIGDGDHGLNMARGFEEAAKRIGNGEYEDLGKLFKDVSMALLSKVGGASGPLYGTVFMKLSASLNGKSDVGQEDFSRALQSALDGLKMRGKAQIGEKTMVDVWEPVVEFVRKTSDFQTDELVRLAKEQMEATKDMEATKGRAAYLGKRSVGHIDPGAASSYLFFETLANYLHEGDS